MIGRQRLLLTTTFAEGSMRDRVLGLNGAVLTSGFTVAATQAVELTGIHLAIGVNVAVLAASVVVVWFGLRLRGGQPAPAVPAFAVAAD